MEVVHARCAGLDVHKKSVTGCIISPTGKEIRTFGTMTSQLIEMRDWLLSNEVTSVAMESTGVYWIPIYNLLEESGMELVVVNAAHMKNVPGRKTDVKDAEWIASLMRHGLVRGSFIPDRDQRELRELVRYRRSLIQEQSRVANRIQKVLEGANIKLGDVASDVLGKSGRDMLRAIAEGETDPTKLASFARRSLKNKQEALEQALRGVIGPHQRMMLATQLRHVEFLEQEISRLDQEVADRMRPFDDPLERLDGIPGVGRRTAEEILAETGTDMSRFPSAAHIASWAGMCPGNNESAGKRRSGRTNQGNTHLKSALVLAAHAAAKTKDTYLAAQYRRLAGRIGAKRAAVALGHTLLVIIYNMLKHGTPYRELGPQHFDQIRERSVVAQSIKRLESLGYAVTVEKSEPAA